MKRSILIIIIAVLISCVFIFHCAQHSLSLTIGDYNRLSKIIIDGVTLNLTHTLCNMTVPKEARQLSINEVQSPILSDTSKYNYTVSLMDESKWNRTRIKSELVIYNRVPKCGSTTMNYI